MSEDRTRAQTMSTGFPKVTEADWLAEVTRSLSGRDAAGLGSLTADGIGIEALHGRATEPLAIPGAPSSPPEVMPLVIETDPDTANRVILAELKAGASGVVVQMAAPGQPGLAMAPETLRAALAGVHLDAAKLTLAPGGCDWSQAVEGFASLVRNTDVSPCGLSLGADPIGAGLGPGKEISPAGLITLADFATTLADVPGVRIFSASGLPAHEAGATEAQELASMLASGVAYLRALEAAGLPPRTAARWIGLELGAEADIFLSIAKLRAARLLWARMLELCDGGNGHLHLTARSSARMMARAETHTNLLRTAAAALAATLGGANALTVLPFTHALGRPDALARRMARNQAIILAEEAYLGTVADPASGSGFVDHLTQSLAAKAWALFQRIEAAGGAQDPSGAALSAGLIAEAQKVREAEIATGARKLVGVNAFVNAMDTPPEVEPWPA